MKKKITQLDKSDQTISFSDDQVALIKSQIAKDATNDELQLFLYQAQKTGLDPFARQIYFIKRGGKGTIQVSIDGFRVVAERSGKYAGQDEPVFTEENGRVTKCVVTVYKFSENDTRYPAASGVAYWNEYAQSTPLWQKMPHTMLSKCAESVALRKAFPQDLSGLYTSDEMEQADAQLVDPPKVYEEGVTEAQLDHIYELIGMEKFEANEPKLRELTKDKAAAYIAKLEKEQAITEPRSLDEKIENLKSRGSQSELVKVADGEIDIESMGF